MIMDFDKNDPKPK
jgi:hypothetical protein